MSRGFTLVELLVALALASILGALGVAAVGRARAGADAAMCVSGLRQLGVASSLYLSEHEQRYFAYSQSLPEGRLWYFGFEPWASLRQPEGQRELDPTRGPLYPYVRQVGGIEVCRAFPYDAALWKPKFKGASHGYGFNTQLSGRHALAIERPSQVVVFGDSAQVNTFQVPASASNPMIEEFYLIDSTFKTVHFRHNGRANFLFADGHVAALDMAPGTQDMRMPDAQIGRITPVGSLKHLR